MKDLTLSEHETRRERLRRIIASGIDPYPSRVRRTHTIENLLRTFDAQGGFEASITGRVMAVRTHGSSVFIDLADGTGRMQAYLTKDAVGEGRFQELLNTLDVADFIEASGTTFLTKMGEPTLRLSSLRIITKTLEPLPEKWHGLHDIEQRFRKRYLDLVMNPEVKQRFRVRSQLISTLRKFLDERGFVEVETPTLQPVYGGGFARPFVTHHNALDVDFYLRISDEMYLKRLIVGGFEKVYEITKVYRNEGIDQDHNPEFTMWEAQIAYEDYRYGMDLIEEIFETLARSVLNTTALPYGNQVLEFKRPWKRLKLVEAVYEHTRVDPLTWASIEEARHAAKKLITNEKKLQELERVSSVGETIAFVFEECVEERLIQPTIIYDYPIEVSPLAKKCDDPRFTQRFEMFIAGFEVGNNYSELNDPLDLEKRFIEEKKREDAGFEEAHQTDYDYLTAIKHGFPPTCGVAIGIDRMVMLFTNAQNIKEVIFFPTLRPKPSEKSPRPASVRDTPPGEGIMTKSPLERGRQKDGGVFPRDQALALLREHVKNENLVKHMLAVEAVMRMLAQKFNGNPDLWGLSGLLHDIDWEETANDFTQHSLKSAECLAKAGVNQEVVQAVKVHNHTHGFPLETVMEKALFCAEELTGIITACALVQPSKKLTDVTVESILKKFKQPAFAKGVNREIILRCEELLGMKLEELAALELHAMQGIAEELGL